MIGGCWDHPRRVSAKCFSPAQASPLRGVLSSQRLIAEKTVMERICVSNVATAAIVSAPSGQTGTCPAGTISNSVASILRLNPQGELGQTV